MLRNPNTGVNRHTEEQRALWVSGVPLSSWTPFEASGNALGQTPREQTPNWAVTRRPWTNPQSGFLFFSSRKQADDEEVLIGLTPGLKVNVNYHTRGEGVSTFTLPLLLLLSNRLQSDNKTGVFPPDNTAVDEVIEGLNVLWRRGEDDWLTRWEQRNARGGNTSISLISDIQKGWRRILLSNHIRVAVICDHGFHVWVCVYNLLRNMHLNNNERQYLTAWNTIFKMNIIWLLYVSILVAVFVNII